MLSNAQIWSIIAWNCYFHGVLNFLNAFARCILSRYVHSGLTFLSIISSPYLSLNISYHLTLFASVQSFLQPPICLPAFLNLNQSVLYPTQLYSKVLTQFFRNCKVMSTSSNTLSVLSYLILYFFTSLISKMEFTIIFLLKSKEFFVIRKSSKFPNQACQQFSSSIMPCISKALDITSSNIYLLLYKNCLMSSSRTNK